MAIRDGLGFEEVNQSGTNTTLVQATSGTFTRVSDANGEVISTSVGSPVVYGPKMQVGTVATAAGSSVTIEFGTQFATGGYKISVTAGSVLTTQSAYISGTRNVSGCLLIGGASTRYDFIAVGL